MKRFRELSDHQLITRLAYQLTRCKSSHHVSSDSYTWASCSHDNCINERCAHKHQFCNGHCFELSLVRSTSCITHWLSTHTSRIITSWPIKRLCRTSVHASCSWRWIGTRFMRMSDLSWWDVKGFAQSRESRCSIASGYPRPPWWSCWPFKAAYTKPTSTSLHMEWYAAHAS